MGKRVLIENKTVGKSKMLLGIFLIIIGFISLFKNVVLALSLLVVGFLIYAIGKFQRWFWND